MLRPQDGNCVCYCRSMRTLYKGGEFDCFGSFATEIATPV